MTSDDLDVFFELVGLSEPQAMAARTVFATYLADYQSTSARLMPDLNSASILAARNAASEQDYAVFAQRRKSAAQRLMSLDDGLFDGITPILTDTQRELLVTRVLPLRRRDRCTLLGSRLPGSNVDLGRLAWQTLIDRRQDPAVTAILGQYDQQATPLFEERYWTTLEGFAEAIRLRAKLERGLLSSGEYPRLLEAALSRGVTISRRIARVNQQAMAALGGVVSAAEQARLVDAFRAAAFPAIFPDPFDAQSLIALIRQENVDLDSALSEYARQQAHVNDQMVQRYVRWHEAFLTTMRIDQGLRESYVREMNELQRARHQNLARLLQVVRTNEHLSELPDVQQQIVRLQATVSRPPPLMDDGMSL